MTPNRRSPAYALFASRPIVHSRRMSSLRIHPPARNRSRRPVPKTPPVSIATLRRSKFDIGVISAKDGLSGPWYWSLPPADQNQEAI
jgi:hypothetical protein